MYYYFYKITNNTNGKYYYGVHSTDDLNDGYMGSGKYLHNAYNKYGQSNFTKEIIKYFSSSDDMYSYEKEIVTEDLVNDPNCYNLALGGGGSTGWTMSLSDEEKKQHSQKMSEIMSKITCTQEYRDKMSKSTSGEKNGMYGYQWSDEQNRKRSETMKQVYKDPIKKQNLMNGLSKRGDEWRKHISESHKNKKLSEEHKQAISEANKGHVASDETRKKISLANKGKKRPKISEALRGKPSGTSGKHWKLDPITNKRIYY